MTYEELRETIHQALDRDGQLDWDETARLAEVVASKVWNTYPEIRDSYGEWLDEASLKGGDERREG